MIVGYHGSVAEFLDASRESVLGEIVGHCNNYNVVSMQRSAWVAEIDFLKRMLTGVDGWRSGRVYFEFKLLGMSKWADVILLIDGIVFVLEFKVKKRRGGESRAFNFADIEQVEDYASSLSDCNSECHACPIVPILIDTGADSVHDALRGPQYNVYPSIRCVSFEEVKVVLESACGQIPRAQRVQDYDAWEGARYSPTPTVLDIVENTWDENDDPEMLRSGIGNDGVRNAVEKINSIIEDARRDNRKVICFVTGVPGAGKTLVGLKLAGHRLVNEESRSFITGNYPLINVLRTKWVRSAKRAISQHRDMAEKDGRISESWKSALQKVGLTVSQDATGHYNVEGSVNDKILGSLASNMLKPVKTFREAYSSETTQPPNQHVVAFDEAQRAWIESDNENAGDGMSEPEEILSYMDLHKPAGCSEGWCVLVVLIGTGQDIHTNEAGISSWYKALTVGFNDWHVYAPFEDGSPEFANMQLAVGERLRFDEHLHLDTPMRSFRAKMLSQFVEALLREDGTDVQAAREALSQMQEEEDGKVRFRLYVTHDLNAAKAAMREMLRNNGKKRCGILASSKGKRLRKCGVFTPNEDFNEVTWFLNDNWSIESSTAMEVAASEFKVQGLEIDYAILAWDGDLRYDATGGKFNCYAFSPSRAFWKPVGGRKKDLLEKHLRNAYRVLLTRAREGMVIYIPTGDRADASFPTSAYEDTYRFFAEILGVPLVDEYLQEG